MVVFSSKPPPPRPSQETAGEQGEVHKKPAPMEDGAGPVFLNGDLVIRALQFVTNGEFYAGPEREGGVIRIRVFRRFAGVRLALAVQFEVE